MSVSGVKRLRGFRSSKRGPDFFAFSFEFKHDRVEGGFSDTGVALFALQPDIIKAFRAHGLSVKSPLIYMKKKKITWFDKKEHRVFSKAEMQILLRNFTVTKDIELAEEFFMLYNKINVMHFSKSHFLSYLYQKKALFKDSKKLIRDALKHVYLQREMHMAFQQGESSTMPKYPRNVYMPSEGYY